ncbi:MAG: hypothetical protein AAFY71_10300 [Bacteroidota bacterium]
MKHLIISLLLLFSCSFLAAQQSRASLEVNYPLTLGNNFINNFYTSYVDLGFRYRFYESSSFQVGGAFHTSFISSQRPIDFDIARTRLHTLQPGIFIEFSLPGFEIFQPFLGVNYAGLFFDLDNTPFNGLVAEDAFQSGINPNAGFLIKLSEKVFLKAQYDFIKTFLSDPLVVTPFNSQIHIIKMGVGVKL